MFKKGFIAIIILFFLASLLVSQTSPEKFLGHQVGADKKLADYSQIQAYFKNLDQASEKIKVINIGKSTLGKDMIMAIITSEQNMAKLDHYRAISKKLRDARGLSQEQAQHLAKEGKVIVLITCSLHATEIAASQMSMEFAYKLVTGDTPFDSQKVLDDVIILLVPTSNPDGHQMVTEWYRKNVGTKWEGGRMPWLYHHYAGHDNNRDWFMFNLSETRAVNQVLYHDWIPQIHIDEHQMGSTGARLFIPPFMNPPVPTIHPLVWRGVALCGINMAFDLQKNDFTGIVYDRSFTGWWIGACDDTSWLHNSIGLLSEMASVKIASPIYIDSTELPKSYVEKRMQLPDPWPGGWWKLRQLVDYEITFSMSLIKTAFLHKQDFLANFYKMCKDGIDKQKPGQPFAFVIPQKQRDLPTALRMLEIMKRGGIEIHQAKADFTAGRKTFKSGDFVVLMAQPYRPYAQSLLEKQKYPDMRQYPGGPPIPPYDNAGWTLPLQMGVDSERINSAFKSDLQKLETITYPESVIKTDQDPYIVLDTKKNGSYAIVFALLKNKAEIYRAKEGINDKGFHACPGSFIIKNSAKVKTILPKLIKKWPVPVYGLKSIKDIPKAPLTRNRFALYQSWRSSMDEGWTRYMLDDLDVPFKTIHNKDFKGGKGKPVNLNKRFDVIIFASESPRMIKSGSPDPKSRWARYYTPMPPPYDGGIGKEGVKALKDFVAKGGILVTLNNATGLPLKEFKIPAANALEKIDRSKFFCPTSILKVLVKNRTPIGYGLSKETSVIFSGSPAFRTWVPSPEWDRTVVASYPKENILLSGWLLGEETLSRRAAVVDAKYKKGHIILIGFKCQHRAQSHGSYKFLLNALLYPQL